MASRIPMLLGSHDTTIKGAAGIACAASILERYSPGCAGHYTIRMHGRLSRSDKLSSFQPQFSCSVFHQGLRMRVQPQKDPSAFVSGLCPITTDDLFLR